MCGLSMLYSHHRTSTDGLQRANPVHESAIRPPTLTPARQARMPSHMWFGSPLSLQVRLCGDIMQQRVVAYHVQRAVGTAQTHSTSVPANMARTELSTEERYKRDVKESSYWRVLPSAFLRAASSGAPSFDLKRRKRSFVQLHIPRRRDLILREWRCRR